MEEANGRRRTQEAARARQQGNDLATLTAGAAIAEEATALATAELASAAERAERDAATVGALHTELDRLSTAMASMARDTATAEDGRQRGREMLEHVTLQLQAVTLRLAETKRAHETRLGQFAQMLAALMARGRDTGAGPAESDGQAQPPGQGTRDEAITRSTPEVLQA